MPKRKAQGRANSWLNAYSLDHHCCWHFLQANTPLQEWVAIRIHMRIPLRISLRRTNTLAFWGKSTVEAPSDVILRSSLTLPPAESRLQ